MTEEESHDPTQQTEQPQIEQPQPEQPEQAEQTTEQANEQQQTDSSKDQNEEYIDDTLTSMKLRIPPPRRRYATQIAELLDPNLFDFEKGVKINPIQLRKGPRNRMPQQAFQFQDKALFNSITQIRKNPLELRKSPHGRRYSHVVSAAINGESLIANNQLPTNLQYNNEAEDVLGKPPLPRSPENKNKKENGNKNNEEESGFESATSDSSDYEKSMPKSKSSLQDYNELGEGSNSDNGEQKEQKQNPLRTRTAPKRRVSSEVAPLLDQSKNEIKERSINLEPIEGVESNDYQELDRNDTNNYADNQPWVILPGPQTRERSITIEEPYETVGPDGRTYADNAPWVIQDEENPNQLLDPRALQVQERGSPQIEEPEENYQTVGEDGRNYADSAPWVVQDEEALNPQIEGQEVPEQDENQSTPQAQQRGISNNEGQQGGPEENYQTVGEDGRNYADGAPWVVQDEEQLNNQENNQETSEEQENQESANAPIEGQQTPESQGNEEGQQERETNLTENQPEGAEENYQTVGEDGRNYADSAPWVVQDEDQLNNQEENQEDNQETPKDQENPENQETPEAQEGKAGEQERETNLTENQPEGAEENYQTVGEDGRNYADSAPWVVQDEDQLNNQEENQENPEENQEDNQEESQQGQENQGGEEEQERESNLIEGQPEEEENYETIGEDGRKYADSAPWVVQDEDQLNNQEENQENPEENQENPEENQENQENPEENQGGEEEQERESNLIEGQPEEEENYETIGEDGRKYADSAPWVVQDEDQLNNQEENQENPEENQENPEENQENPEENQENPEENQENPEENQGGDEEEQERESNLIEGQPEEEDNYEQIGEDGRKYADNAPWVVQDEDQLINSEEEEQQEQEQGSQEEGGQPSAPPTTTPEEGPQPWVIEDEEKAEDEKDKSISSSPTKPRKIKRNKNAKKVDVSIQTIKSFLSDKEQNEEEAKDNNEAAVTKRSSPSKATKTTKDNEKQVRTRSLNVDEEQKEATQEPKKTTQKQKQQTTKKQPATTTTAKKQQQQKQATEPTSKTTSKASSSTSAKKQPATKKTADTTKPISGKPSTREPKLDKNNKKNYADNQPWVIHEEDDAQLEKKKPTTTSRSAKVNNNNTKKQPATKSTSNKEEPKKTTTSTSQNKKDTKKPSSTSTTNKASTSSSKTASKKEEPKKTTTTNKKSTSSKKATLEPENEVTSRKQTKTKSAPLDKNDPKNYADNQPWVVHDEKENATSSSKKKPSTSSQHKTEPKKSTTTSRSVSSKQSKPSSSTDKKQQSSSSSKKKPSTTTTSSTTKKETEKKQSATTSDNKKKPTTTTTRSVSNKSQQKPTKNTQKKEKPTSRNDSLDDLPAKVRNSPIGKKIQKAEKETSVIWVEQGILNSTLAGFPILSDSKDELYGENDMRKYIKKNIDDHRGDDSDYHFKVCIVGPQGGGKSTFLSLFTDELLKDMINNDAWKSTFVFIFDFCKLEPCLTNPEEVYKNIIQTSISCISWSRSPLFKYKRQLDNYFNSIRQSSSPPKEFPADANLSDDEISKIDEIIDREAVQNIANEIHQTWNDQSNPSDIYKLIFEIPNKLSEACRFEKSIYILDHVDDCTLEKNDENQSNEEVAPLKDIISDLLDNANCIVSCHDSNHFIEVKKDFERIDIATIVDQKNAKNKNYNFSVQIKEKPKNNLNLTVDHCQGAPALLCTWNKMIKTADSLNKAKSNEKKELNDKLKELTQNLVNAVFAGEINTSGEDKTVESVKLLDRKKPTK
ncbi:hypothetical protein M9Y10_015234 [Tritrichomonas musculus]|uniref:Uncharacterized protein n=1 Tax=Tritrichomonas musculus TaxID=1915356 RepID=A0ABR2L1Q7_9EUKA